VAGSCLCGDEPSGSCAMELSCYSHLNFPLSICVEISSGTVFVKKIQTVIVKIRQYSEQASVICCHV
jgi:hypothetical protein